MTIYRQIRKETVKAFNRYVQKTGDYLQTYITEEKRLYKNDNNNITIRRYGRGITGKIAGSPRDVVDSKETENSYGIIDIKDTDTEVVKEIKWDSKASIYVYGGTDKQDPYPWVEIALRRYDLREEFQKEFK